MAILGLLVAISLPAIQQSRESARRLQCQNNLKQIGLAMANVVQVTGKFPTAQLSDPATDSPGMWRLLPYLDQVPLYEELMAHGSSSHCAVPEFVCPDDTRNPVSNYGIPNYGFNDGTTFRLYDPTNGFRKDSRHDTTPAEITDGLSQTAAMAEQLAVVYELLQEDVDRNSERFPWWTETRYGGRGQELLAAQECRTHRTTQHPRAFGPSPNYRGMGYDHLLNPNENLCYNGPEDFDFDPTIAIIPPSSYHPGGVNVLFADGSVHFIQNQIAESVWRALGTRNGNETVGEF